MWLAPVQDGVAYDVRIRAINALGVRSAWMQSSNHTVVGKTASPADPNAFTVTLLADGNHVFLTTYTSIEIDFSHFVFDVGGTIVCDDTHADRIICETALLKTPGSYTVGVRAVDTTGNVSNKVTVAYSRKQTSDVATFSVSQNGAIVVLIWSQVTDVDLDGYDIRFGPIGGSFADVTPLTQVTKGTQVTTAAVPPGTWLFHIKAKDTSGNYSVNAATASITVTNANDLILQTEQSKAWPGTLTNMIRHHTGVLVPDSQNLASADAWPTFDTFVVNPYADCYFEAAEFDIDFDDTVRVWGAIESALGPGATGEADPALEIDHHKVTTAYDGFELWVIGDVDCRYVKHRVHLDTSVGVAYISGFLPTCDLLERSEGAQGVSVGAGGLAVTFARKFHAVPNVQATVQAGSALIPTVENVTTTGFTIHIYNTAGVEVGGTADWEAKGA